MAKLSGRLVWNLRRTYVMSNAFPVGANTWMLVSHVDEVKNPLLSPLCSGTRQREHKPPCATRPRGFPNALRVGCARQAVLSLETVRVFPGLRSWLRKAHLWCVLLKFCFPGKLTVYYVLIQSAFYPQRCCFYKSLIKRQKGKYLLAFFWVLPRF